ncbi:dephospho-CoA kinase [Streptococcus entericus]|uniref:dephospho-CoA kinase n=1 Tax=Streptococcus entericus TaxID=155680 RepID=UPI0030158913
MARVIGLTGGIASGKSTVSAYLRRQGVAVVDADQLVHNLQAKGGKLYQALVNHFGSGILRSDGELDRPKLAELIFSSPEQLATSSELQDEIIRQALVEEKARLAALHDVVVLDIPLLFEKGYASWCDEVWLVAVDEETQLQRLMARNGYTLAQAQTRLQSQMSLAEKQTRADRVIDNTGDLSATYAQVDQLLQALAKGRC